MSNRKRQAPAHILEIRLLLQELAKGHIKTAEDKAKASKQTSLSKSYIDQMIYQGKGGLDAWLELLLYIYDLKPDQLEPLIIEVVKSLKKSRPISEGQAAFIKFAETLNEDRLQFWSSLISFSESSKLTPPKKKK